MKKLLPLLALLFISFSACEEDEPELNNGDYLIFGQFAGFCVGDCFAVFRVDAQQLTEDEVVQRFNRADFIFTSGRVLDNEAFNTAKDLLTEIPSELINSESDLQTFGCPDCADQGGYYLSFSLQGAVKTFILDTRTTEDQSETLLAFKEKLSLLIEEVR